MIPPLQSTVSVQITATSYTEISLYESPKLHILHKLYLIHLVRRKKKKMRGGMIVMDWEQIVRRLSVSSNESQANRLTDGIHSTFWQSSGPQGKVSEVENVFTILSNVCMYTF